MRWRPSVDRIDETRAALAVGLLDYLHIERTREAVLALADEYALEVLEEAVSMIEGNPDWHRGHDAPSCPQVVLAALRARLVPRKGEEGEGSG